MRLKSSSHSVHHLMAHLVFVTKYRRKAINMEMLHVIESIIKQKLIELNCSLEEFNGESDHVHILIRYSPDVPLSRIVQHLKGNTSFHIRKIFKNHLTKYYWKRSKHFWSAGYFCCSVGGAPLDVLKQYIKNQDTPKQ